MKRLLTSLTLITALVWLAIPTTIAQQRQLPTTEAAIPTEADLQVAFENELTQYGATHTTDEVMAYARQRIDQMTTEALTFDGTTTQGAAIAMDGSAEVQSYDIFIYPDLWDYDDGSNDPRLRFCMETRSEECRNNYNSELFASAAAATAIFAGCLAISGGTAAVVCAAAALAAHALAIASAKQRYYGCLARAKSDCYLQYGAFKQ